MNTLRKECTVNTPTATTEDFRATKTFTAAPDAVNAALTDVDALTAWWAPAGGGADAGETLRFLMGYQEVVMGVEQAVRPSRVRWNVLDCEAAHDWDGTSIAFELEPAGTGTVLRFHHVGLHPGLECFDQCHSGWTRHLASLVDHVDRAAGSPNPPADAEYFAAWRAKHAAG
jgi:uncharacterized protein YndB with AHSA1/START domain